MNLQLPLEIHAEVLRNKQSAIDCLLQTKPQLDYQTLLTCIENGALWLETGKRISRLNKPDTPLKQKNRLYLYCSETTLTECPYQPQLIEDHQSFSLWFKPAGMLSQGSKWGDHWALYRWIEQHYWKDRRCFISHRLDRYTSGLMLVAHDADINRKLHRLFESRQVRKTYRAIVAGMLQAGETRYIDQAIDNKPAKTSIKSLGSNQQTRQSLLEIQPETGRKHQIRRHLSDHGFPVVNDRQYGRPPFSGDLALQASAIALKLPSLDLKLQVTLDDSILLKL